MVTMLTMSFTDQKPWIATEEDVKANWNCRKPGHDFRCAWCGHSFQVGDMVRWVYTNGGGEETCGINGNPFICQSCDGPRDEVLAKLRAMAHEAKTRMWWFTSRTGCR